MMRTFSKSGVLVLFDPKLRFENVYSYFIKCLETLPNPINIELDVLEIPIFNDKYSLFEPETDTGVTNCLKFKKVTFGRCLAWEFQP